MVRHLRLSSLLIAFAVGCGGSDPTGPESVTSIAVTSSASSINAIGATTQLTATGKDAKGRDVGSLSFTWSSSNTSVATVSGGLVTAVGNGTTTITATMGTLSGTTQITVQQIPTEVTVTLPAETITAHGETMQASGAVRDARGNAISGGSFNWSSTNAGVATVDGTGLITAVSDGTTQIRVSSGTFQAEKQITVQQRAAGLAFVTQPGGARAGIVLTTQPSVQVVDARGNRVTGDNTTVVTATMQGSNATVTAGATRTMQNGVATFSGLTIGGTAGQHVLRVTAPSMTAGESTPFTLSAGDAAAVAVSAGNNQTGLANVDLPLPLQAVVRDAFNNPVANVEVEWAVTTGSGAMQSPSSASNTSGIASNVLKLSRFAGANGARATLALTGSQANFTATGTPNAVVSGTVSPLSLASVPTAAVARGAASASVQASNARVPATLPRLTANASKPVPRTRAATAGPNVQSAAIATGATEYVPGELLVTYHDDLIGANARGAAAARNVNLMRAVQESITEAIQPLADAGIVEPIAVSPAIRTARVKLGTGVTEGTAIARLRQDSRVRTVERNPIAHSYRYQPTALEEALAPALQRLAFAAANQPLSSRGLLMDPGHMTYPGGGLFPTDALYVNQSWHYNVTGLPRAWEMTTGSANVLVAVVDDGIRFDHPAMAGLLTNDGYDFVSATIGALTPLPPCAGGAPINPSGDGDDYDPDPTVPMKRPRNTAGTCLLGPEESGGHGLHVSATIASAPGNSFGLVGINRQLRIRPIRALGIWGSGSFFDIAQGVLYAAGIAVPGAGGAMVQATPGAKLINMSLGGSTSAAVLENAVNAATAAGSLVIAAAGNSNTSALSYPAAYAAAISVSALGPTLARASYSNFGNWIDIAAPGGQSSVADPSQGVYSATWNFTNHTPTFDGWNGTSMAAPHVTGIAALLLAREPALTPAQVRERLQSFAVDLGPAGKDNTYGWGLINARNALTSTHKPAGATRVYLINAATGATVQTVAAAGNGDFSFTQIADGQYWVFAGEDETSDGLTGVPGRRWSGFGLAGNPTTITVNGAAAHTATLYANAPTEVEPNNVAQQANVMLPDSYINGSLSSPSDVDIYKLRVLQAGSYTILAQGQNGACGFTLEADPMIGVFSSTGTLLAANDDIDVLARNYCARTVLNLTPGDHYIQVEPYTTGRYVLSVRRN